MPKISDERRAERRAQIIDAARRCFQREGVHATTMDDIIQASGLSAGAVYSYFRSKDELTLASLSANLSGLQDALGPLLQGAVPGPEAFLQAVSSLILTYSDRDGYDTRRIAIMGWGEAQRNEAFRDILRCFYLGFRDELRNVASSWQQQGFIGPAANAEDVAKASMAFLLGFVAQSAILDDVTPDALARGLHDLLARTEPSVTPSTSTRAPQRRGRS
jgi:TetR/AcrR family transcriptional regulator, transcriptional repressor of aconitase